jgi:hypothetical protein
MFRYRLTALSGPLTGAATGAVLPAGYGVLVAAVHFVSTGRWDRSLTFASWSVLAGAALGLAVGVAFALTTRPRSASLRR